MSRATRETLLINLARLLWRLSERLTHYANALFVRAINHQRRA